MAGQSSVIPVIATNINWVHFLKDAKALTGHSPTFNIDQSSIPLSDYKKWIMALEEFSGYSELPLEQLFFGFLISLSTKNTISEIILRTRLSVVTSKNKEVAIVSGTLKTWQYAVIDILTNSKNPNLIDIFNQVYLFFRKLGLESIWSNYHKKSVGETFLLEYCGGIKKV